MSVSWRKCQGVYVLFADAILFAIPSSGDLPSSTSTEHPDPYTYKEERFLKKLGYPRLEV